MVKHEEEEVLSKKFICVDYSCLVIIGLLVLYFELFMDPPKIGYFCDDNSIRYPMKSETISNTVLVWVVCVMPIFYIAVIELYRQLKMATPKDSCVTVSTQVFGRLMKIYGAYMFGIGFTQLCMDVSKYLLGWLRPHFLDACKPRVDPCKLLLPEELHTLVTNYECTGDPKVVKEARLTFPSGHAAHSFYTAIFLSIFLQYRLPRKKLRLPIHLVQAVLLLAAYSCALTRLHDNMHHFRDMVAGIVTGTVVALLTINYVSDMKNIAKHGMDQHSLISMRTSSFHTHHV